jgi:hypothetical protein
MESTWGIEPGDWETAAFRVIHLSYGADGFLHQRQRIRKLENMQGGKERPQLGV